MARTRHALRVIAVNATNKVISMKLSLIHICSALAALSSVAFMALLVVFIAELLALSTAPIAGAVLMLPPALVPAPVSYTHLDVYKRQTLTLSPPN